MSTSKVFLTTDTGSATLGFGNGLARTSFTYFDVYQTFTNVNSTNWTITTSSGLSSPDRTHGEIMNLTAQRANIAAVITGGLSLSDYTFPGGNTLPSSRSKISITGNWFTQFSHTSGGSIQTIYQFQTDTNNGTSGSYERTNLSGAVIPQFTSTSFTSTATTYSNIGSDVTGGASDTITANPFFANLIFSAATKNSNGQFSSTDAAVAYFQFDVARQYEANLIIIDGSGGDTAPSITSDVSFTVGEILIVKFGAGNASIDSETTFTANNTVGFSALTANYTQAGYIDIDYTETGTFPVSLTQTGSSESTLACLGGIAQFAGNVSIEIANTVVAVEGNLTLQQTFTQTPSSEFSYAVTGNLTISDTVSLTSDAVLSSDSQLSIQAALVSDITTTFAATPTVTVKSGAVSMSSDCDFGNQYYVDDYIAPGYVGEQAGNVIRGATLAFTSDFTANLSGNVDNRAASALTIDTATQIETTVEMIVEANISADAAIQGTGGYLRTSGNVIFDGDTAVSISQYITGGTGVILGSTQASLAMTGLSLSSGSNLTMIAQAVFDASLSIFIQAGRLDFYSAQIESGGDPYVEDLYTVPNYFVTGTGGVTLSCLGEISTNTGAHLLSEFNWQINAGFGLFGNTTVDLFAMTLSLGATARIARSDEFYTYRVPMELRQLYIQARLNVLIVADEQRINMITAEPRELAIGSETRTLKVNMAPATLESPRIRRLA